MTDLRKLPHGNVVRQIPFAQQSMAAGEKAPGLDKLKAVVRQKQSELRKLQSRPDKGRPELDSRMLEDDLSTLQWILELAQKGDKNGVLSSGSRAETAVREEIPREMWKWAGGNTFADDASNAVSMARSVPAGTKVTTDKGDSGTLAQAWDGTSLRVIINSDKRGRIEVHPSNVYVNGRSLRDMAGGHSMQAVQFTAQAEASWKSWYDRRAANITVQEAQHFRDALLELADKTENRALHDKAVADAKRMSNIRVDVGTTHAGMKPLWDIVDRWPGVSASTLKKVWYQWQDIAAGRA